MELSLSCFRTILDGLDKVKALQADENTNGAPQQLNEIVPNLKTLWKRH